MKRYKVIWFDDEHSTLEQISEEASLNAIDLVGFSNAKEGIEHLKRNIAWYDAVVVDGVFFLKPGESADQAKDIALLDVATALRSLEDQKALPWFILSGQPSYTKHRHAFADLFKNNDIFDKHEESHRLKLWERLKQEADFQIETQIRHRYNDFFEGLSECHVPEEQKQAVLEILRNLYAPARLFNVGVFYNQLRQVIEWVFRDAHRLRLLHANCIQRDQVNLSESLNFMAGAPCPILRVKCAKAHFPKVISDHIGFILGITNSGSHTSTLDEAKTVNLRQFRETVDSANLLYALIFMLMDVILWYRHYRSENCEEDENETHWRTMPEQHGKEWISGEVVKVENGFGTFLPHGTKEPISIPPALLSQFSIEERDKLEVTTKVYIKEIRKQK